MAAGGASDPNQHLGDLARWPAPYPMLDLRPEPVLDRLVGARWERYVLPQLAVAGSDLSELVAERCVLDGADLRHCTLRDAHLVETTLIGADLRDASLRHAVLVQVDLRGADLSDADLHGAVLVLCDLRHCRLAGADLRDTVWSRTDLRSVDLSRGLLAGARGDFYWDDTTSWPEDFTP